MYQFKLPDTAADPWRNLISEIALSIEYNGFFTLAINISADDTAVEKVIKILKLIIRICRDIMDDATGFSKLVIIKIVVRFPGKENDAIGRPNCLCDQVVNFFSTTDMIKREKQEDVKFFIEWLFGSVYATKDHKWKDENIFDYSFNYKKIVHGDYQQK